MNNLKITIITLFAFIAIATACCKKPTPPPTTDKNGLPFATQTGANTFGCLIDGVPCVVNGGYNNFLGTGLEYYFGLDSTFYILAKSKNFQIKIASIINGTIPGNFNANQYIAASTTYADFTFGGSPFGNDYYTTSESLPATLTLNKYTGDRVNGGTANDGAFVSGTFDLVLQNAAGKQIDITEGRFDIKR
jgi:hypothetical protein